MSARCRLRNWPNNIWPLSQDYAKCVHWYSQAAEQGYGPAINNLADKYENGRGVPQDKLKARSWLEKAAAYQFLDSVDRLVALR